MHKSRIVLIVVLMALVSVGSIWGQESEEEDELYVPQYSLGDQTLGINLGPFVPLFFAGGPNGAEATGLSLGGAGSLAWSSYLSNNTKLGIEIGGSFSFSRNGRALFMVPIQATGSYVFRAYPWEFPVTLGLGINFSALENERKADPFLKLGSSAYWNYSAQWAFGLNVSYWFIPQIYLDTDSVAAAPSETRLGNFLEITLSALYHF